MEVLDRKELYLFHRHKNPPRPLFPLCRSRQDQLQRAHRGQAAVETKATTLEQSKSRLLHLPQANLYGQGMPSRTVKVNSRKHQVRYLAQYRAPYPDHRQTFATRSLPRHLLRPRTQMIPRQKMKTTSGSQAVLGYLQSPSLQSPIFAIPRYHVQPTSSYHEVPYLAHRDSAAKAVSDTHKSLHRSSSSGAASNKHTTLKPVCMCTHPCLGILSLVQRASHVQMSASLAQSHGHRRRSP
jgi:hypothetical protein